MKRPVIIISFLLMLISFFTPYLASAQFYYQGQDPASVKWMQINTENFRIIFPEDYVDQARYVAGVLEYAYLHAGESLGHKPRKIPVVIHNRTVISNGFVSWAPRRMELFTNPPQDNDNHTWMESLAIHEYRHVVQVDKLNQGITRILSILFGEQATGVVLGLHVPIWFLEGDAVAVETAFTRSGRGRLPSFEQGLRAQVLEQGINKYDKAVFGSYKDYVPDHYQLGYQLVAAARVNHGARVWDHVVDHVAHKPFAINSFSKGLKKQTGTGKTDHYCNTLSFLDSVWSYQHEQRNYSEFKRLTEPADLYTNYRYPSFITENELIALKSSLKDIPAVVLIDTTGKEKKLFHPGITNNYAFSASNGKVAWSEVRTDARWQHRSWSEIFIYDTESGKRKRISRKTRYFAPSLNKDASLIVTVEVTDQNDYNLVILDSETGNVVKKFPSPGNAFLMTPSWNDEGDKIVAISLGEQGKTIVVTDALTGEFNTVAGPFEADISNPAFNGQQIIFSGTFDGIDNLFKIDSMGKVSRIISSEFGAVDASLSPGQDLLVWSDYDSEGYKIAMTNTSGLNVVDLGKVKDNSPRFFQVLARQETGMIRRSEIQEHQHVVEPYSRFANLFKLHSWGPFSLDVDNVQAMPGASLFFQNDLSTSFASIGYQYNINEEHGKFYLDYSYYGWYPVVSVQAETGKRTSFYRNQQQELVSFPWRESSAYLSLSLPLTFRRNEYFSGITPLVRGGIMQAATTEGSPVFLRDNNIFNMQYRLTAYRQRFSVRRDLGPRWGQVVDLNFRHTPFGNKQMGNIYSARLVNFFPGLIRHHSLRVSAGYQKHQPGLPSNNRIHYQFPNLISYPRGISGQYHEELYSFSADYAFPLFYPDWSLPPFVYLQRIRLNLFADYASANSILYQEDTPQAGNEDFFTYGIDIAADMHLLRFLSPVSLGTRIIYNPSENKTMLRLIFGISF